MTKPEIVDVYPLSPMQAGLLFHAVSQPDARAYFVQMQLEITGSLDEATFVEAFAQLFERHDILRTSFVHEAVERPLQVVYEHRTPEIALHDLRGLDANERDRRIEIACAADRERGFDLQHDVLMRMALYRIGEKLHRLVWSYHHMLLDGWCLPILQRDFLEIYASLSEGREPRLPPCPLYRDYIAWLEERDPDAARAHWTNYLRGFELPTGVPARARTGRADVGQHRLALDPALTSGLVALATKSRVTLYTLVQALWGLLLGRYNDTADVVFGSVVSGRPADLDGVEQMVGVFINTVPVRVAFDEEATFASLLRELQAASLDGSAFEYQPLWEVQSTNPLGRELFDHIMIFENYPASTGAGVGEDALSFRSVGSHDRTHYDFNVVVVPGEQLLVTFDYAGAVYGDDEVRRVAEHFETAARFVVEHPATSMAAIPLPATGESDVLRRLGGGEPAATVPAATVVERIEGQVSRTPDAVALRFGEVQWSYRELNAQANALAAQLRADVLLRPDQCVGILLDRSDRLVIAVLGILKAGGAYVPLDPADPAGRRDAIVRDSACVAVVTEARYRDRVPAGIPAIQVALGAGVASNPAPAAGAAHLSYVLYGAESAGELKSAPIEHASLLLALDSAERCYLGSGAGGNFGLFSPLSSNLTVTSLFLPLLRGKTLTVLPERPVPHAPCGPALASVPPRARIRAAPIARAPGAPDTIGARFRRQAALTPQRTAVSENGHTLTYGELARRAEAFGTWLRERGIGPEDVVGLRIKKSVDLVVGVLGVVDAGAAFAVLDPAYPAERLSFMVEDSKPALVLTELPDCSSVTQPAVHRRDATPANLAYVVYTSGSTGRPKGVMVTHRSVVNAYDGWEEAYRLCADTSSHLQMASPSFDVFVGDLVRALLSGGKLVLCSPEQFAEPENLYALMRAESVDAAEFVPAVLRHLLDYVEASGNDLTFMRLLAIGSDLVRPDDHRRLLAVCGPATHIANSYGVSECTIDSTYFSGIVVEGAVPIGGPFAGSRTYVLDEALTPVPAGTPGDLYIGGTGVARGYRGRAGMTAERFLADPWSGERGSRMYRTGDRVRVRDDGMLEFLGRADGQVKIRGVRVEPGEVEAAILAHETLVQAVVVAHADGAGDDLVAYLVARRGTDPDLAALRRALDERLPAVMVPAAFVVLDALPLTPNGKVDRSALAALPRPGDGGAAETQRLSAVLEAIFDGRHGIDCVKLTPSQLAVLDGTRLTSTPVRIAIVSGEPLVPRQAEVLWRLNPAMRIFNEYGLMEATAGCLVHELGRGETTIPIGRPLAGSSVAIRDRRGRPMPLGMPGEICVGGPGLARDCVNPPERLVRTRDYGRVLPSGEIEYLGRSDRQRNTRGRRVALGEIETALQRFPGVARALALADGSALEAYVESAAGIDPAALRAHVRGLLPAFLVPQRIVRVERMPLTAAGRIDVNRLTRFTPSQSPGDAAREEPRDAVERTVVAIWKQVLGEGPIGLTASFFDLGGHSLKAMQVMSRLRKELSVDIGLRAFLAAPTVAELAALVRAASPSAYAAIAPVPTQDHYDLSDAQERLWIMHGMGGEIAYNMPKAYVYGGALDVDALRHAVAALLDRHEALRTAFVHVDGAPKQRIAESVPTPFATIDLRAEPDPEAAARAFAERDATTPFELHDAPLLRVTVMRLAERRHVIALNMHHIIGDGWSMEVLQQELLVLYEAFRHGTADPLPPLRIQYKDFSAWQAGRDRAASEAYWLERLRGVPEGLRLPFDHAPTLAERNFRGATGNRRMPAATVAALRELAARTGTTVSNLFLAAFGLALWTVSRQDDFCIGMSVANRDDVELERLIGFFVNILPIRLRMSSADSIGDVLERCAADVYQAFDHRDYPFDQLVRMLNPGRYANRQPLLNVVYGFQSFRDVQIDVGSAATEVSPLDAARDFTLPLRSAKFDLCLFVGESADTLVLDLEYDTGLFEARTIERLLTLIEDSAGHLLDDWSRPIGALLSSGRGDDAVLLERLRELDRTATAYPHDATVSSLFSEIARAFPEKVAVAYQHERMTYEELDRRSNDVARFLIAAGVEPEHFVGVLLDRSAHMVVTLLGILKAGAAYAPLNADVPYERLNANVADTRARILITEKRYIRIANKLQWDCPDLASFLCIDSDDVAQEFEDGGIMDPAIWNYVAQEAFDDISGGGWTDSYTGEWLSREVMDGYGDNIRAKLAPLLTGESRVLEIGCASGISMFRLAPLVASYVGTDLSPGIVGWSRREAARLGLDNVRLAALPAHDIDRVGERDFDLVILNSVIECFSGHNYLRDVLRKAVALLKPDGYLFLGNVWDQDLKPEFVRSLLEFKRRFPERATRMKLDRSDELCLSRDFLEDLRHEFPEIASISYSHMLGSAVSELSRFGFDALIHIRKGAVHAPLAGRRRRQFDRRALARFDGAPVGDRATASSLAYMMYTSGTSGGPKGVMIEHRSIVRLVRATNYVALGPEDAVLQTGALGFDASTFELWGPLLNGGCVVLPEGKSFLHPADLARLIRENRVTTLFLTTGLFNQIVDLDVDAFAGLRTLLTGGEKASAHHFNLVHARLPNLRLLHVYGPTENTTFSTCYHVTTSHDRDVPIGQPIANTTAIVVDDALRPVPFGMAGELCVGGDGIARGYWGDPDLTARKFVPHPLDPQARVYRTGDLVRRRADGEIEFLGRVDTQTKIRGYRIELEELEGVLLQHEAVTGAAVVAGDFGRGETELVAFVCGRALDTEELLEHVRAALPEYLLPSRLIVLPKLPLNANGKVDRRLLTVPKIAAANQPAVAPASDLEEQLVDIWRRLLLAPEIGVTDNFFRLGGHSLKVARLVAMLESELGITVPLSTVFRAPTIRELANHLTEVSRLDQRLIDDPLVTLNAVQDGEAIFAFPPGSGYCLSYLRLATLLPHPLLGLAFIEADTRLSDYVTLIRAAQQPPYVLFGYSAGGKLAFRVAQELERAGHAVSDVIIFDSACYLRHVSFSEAEIQEVAAEFLDEITSQVLREQAIGRIKAYRRFLGDCVESGAIAADIHLVFAEESPRVVMDADGVPIASLDGWRELTAGRYREYQGSGTHRDMLKPGHLERNVDILRAIVAQRSAAALVG